MQWRLAKDVNDVCTVDENVTKSLDSLLKMLLNIIIVFWDDLAAQKTFLQF